MKHGISCRVFPTFRMADLPQKELARFRGEKLRKTSETRVLTHVFFDKLLGLTALSEFHTHFIDSLHALTRKCVTKRDTLMKQLLEAKDSGLNQTAASMADNETINASELGQGLS